MYREWQAVFGGPFYLGAESFFLLLGVACVPVVIKSHFANRYIGMVGSLQQPFHILEHLFVGVWHNVFGMQPEHWEAIAWILAAEVEHRRDAVRVDVGQQDVLDACLPGASDDLFAVGAERCFVDMAVRVKHF